MMEQNNMKDPTRPRVIGTINPLIKWYPWITRVRLARLKDSPKMVVNIFIVYLILVMRDMIALPLFYTILANQ